MAIWAKARVGLHFIPPGEPWRNGYVESFDSRLRDECLNINSFWSVAQARVVIGDRKHDYNHHRRPAATGQHLARRMGSDLRVGQCQLMCLSNHSIGISGCRPKKL